MKRAPKKKLTAKDIARAMVQGEREAREAGIGLDDFEREPLPRKDDPKHFAVSWFAPRLRQRVTYGRPIQSNTQRGAISEVRAAHRDQVRSVLTRVGTKSMLEGATNYLARKINPGPVPLFCADCDAELKGKSIVMADGRHVCQRCAEKARQIRVDKTQRKLFDEQASLFQNPAHKNVAMGFYDRVGTFHPIRKSHDYNEFISGDLDSPAEKRERSLRHQSKLMREHYAGEEKRARQQFEKRHKSLSQFVRAQGGIAYKARAKGSRGDDLRSKGGGATELGMLSPKETGTTGLLNKSNRQGAQRYSAEYMMDAANAEGYRDRRGQEFDNIGDFISAVADDAAGIKKLFSNQDWGDLENPMKKKAAKGKAKRTKKIICSKCGGAHQAAYCNATPKRNFLGLDRESRIKRHKRRSRVASAKASLLEAKQQLKRARSNSPKPKAQSPKPVPNGLRKKEFEFTVNTAKRGRFAGKIRARSEKAAGEALRKRFKAEGIKSVRVINVNAISRVNGPKSKIPRPKARELARNPKAKVYFFDLKTRKRGKVYGVVAAQTQQAATNKLRRRYDAQGIDTLAVQNPKNLSAVKLPNPMNILEVGSHVATMLMGVQTARALTARAKAKRKRRPSATAAAKRLAHRRHGSVKGRTKTIRRTVNPTAAKAPSQSVQKLFQNFRGQPVSGQSFSGWTPAGTPKDVALLGRLNHLKLANGKVVSFQRTNHALLGGAQVGSKQRLYIGLKAPYAMPNGVEKGKAVNYGEVSEVDYNADKPHLYPEHGHTVLRFYHQMGEEGGKRPVLILQNGVLALRGGDYKIRPEGIRN